MRFCQSLPLIILTLLTSNGGSAIGTEVIGKFDRPELIREWKNESTLVVPLEKMKLKKISPKECEKGAGIFPTHPSQLTKKYHVLRYGQYDETKLRGDDSLCKFSQKVSSRKKGLICFIAVQAGYLMMSDYYMDRCGNYYRGFWEHSFTVANKLDDHPFLLSKGRVNEMIDRGEYMDSKDSDTYALRPENFLFFGEVRPDEIQEILAIRDRSLKNGFRFDPSTYLFKLDRKKGVTGEPEDDSAGFSAK